ncbi:unnamed protein product [Bursaphelenchus okinawaensis]|uniref:Uncharacterized protein n=1 Tax=Bursaphelenchus okinawaensis TaxID=465554 RepID=A0A811K135_9BILA|nr:unnamed protein product [Bursaphelenchus okinawaensis]CAG9088729.1 unnamed protein product [Bursaphelenchus okinawaensis]
MPPTRQRIFRPVNSWPASLQVIEPVKHSDMLLTPVYEDLIQRQTNRHMQRRHSMTNKRKMRHPMCFFTSMPCPHKKL